MSCVENADSVLTILMIGDSNVRRQWFTDEGKARNNRLISFLHFDKDLKMLKQAVLESTISDVFEKGIASLLFLLGFIPSLLLETDAPDIIATTPTGQLVLIECTTRISDFSAKLGKLVHRKNSLAESVSENSRVHGVLVCALPKSQIAVREDELKGHKIILVTKEDIKAFIDHIRYPVNPDELLARAMAKLENDMQIPLPLQ